MRVLRLLEALLARRQAYGDMEAVAERPDGTRVHFVPYPTPLYDASGTLIGAVNMLIDITDRKRADVHAQRLASIVESSDDAIVSEDLNGWNGGAERLFGYRAEGVIGKPVTILIPTILIPPDRISSAGRWNHSKNNAAIASQSMAPPVWTRPTRSWLRWCFTSLRPMPSNTAPC